MTEFCKSCGYEHEAIHWMEGYPFCTGCVNDGSAEKKLQELEGGSNQ